MLEADNIQPAKYQRTDRINGSLEQLRKLSTERIAKNQDFRYILEDIEQVKKQRADKSVSLSEPQRLKEKAEAEARAEARKKERDARPAVTDKVFLVKTETVDKNQPLVALQPPKPKAEDKDKPNAKAPAPKPHEDGEEPEDTTDAAKAILDVYLKETLSILGDYIRLQAKAGRGELVVVPQAK